MPKRIQMTRQRPWRANNPDAVIVDRRSDWGNPFKVMEDNQAGRRQAVDLYKRWALARGEDWLAWVKIELRGSDLACWCPLDQPCHADVLLEIANR